MGVRISAAFMALLMGMFAEPALACPEGQSENSWGWCLPNLGGDGGRILERWKNEARGQSAGYAIAAWLQASRDSAIGTSQPIPPQMRSQLTGFVREDILNRARFKVGDNGILNAASNILGLNGNVSAVTLIDVIVFRDWNGTNGANDAVLWAHELKHVEQYAAWGVKDFGISYARNHDDVEGPAYAQGTAFSNWRASRWSPPLVRQTPPPAQWTPAPATVCASPFGAVPMTMVVPQGSPCMFMTPGGPVQGIAR